jgi:hypothetical protein
VTGFAVWTQSTTGQSETLNAAIYGSDIRGKPLRTPLATTTLSVDPQPAMYPASLPSQLNLSPGKYFVAVEHANKSYIADVTSTTFGNAYSRSSSTAAWTLSALVFSPSFQVFCTGGSSGTVPAIAGSGTPELGNTINIELSGAAPGSLATKFTGFSNTTWAAGPLPFSFAGLGAPGCDLLVSTDAFFGVGTNANGLASIPLAIPNVFPLIGQKLFHQWLIVDPTANTLGISVSNALETSLGG